VPGKHQTPGGELRRNPVSGKLTIVAPGRASRPGGAPAGERRSGASAPADGAAPCPFCAGSESLTPPEVDGLRPDGSAPDTPGWRARVVPNKYPALAGRHEVIVHSPQHGVELEDLGEDGLAEVVGLWQRRIAAQFEAGAAAATLFINRGRGSGASLEHPHEQLIATPAVPPALLDELLEFERFRNRYGGCVLCAEMEEAGPRLVFEDDIVAWAPLAMRFAGELWLAPAAHEPDVLGTDARRLARGLRRALGAIDRTVGDAPFNLWLHTAPAELRGSYHWHVEIAPRRAHLAGFELGSDITIVGADPELEAAALREALSD
jgi:UDPglucose--hexose-1-phosphate uridylyltransferase